MRTSHLLLALAPILLASTPLAQQAKKVEGTQPAKQEHAGKQEHAAMQGNVAEQITKARANYKQAQDQLSATRAKFRQNPGDVALQAELARAREQQAKSGRELAERLGGKGAEHAMPNKEGAHEGDGDKGHGEGKPGDRKKAGEKGEHKEKGKDKGHGEGKGHDKDKDKDKGQGEGKGHDKDKGHGEGKGHDMDKGEVGHAVDAANTPEMAKEKALAHLRMDRELESIELELDRELAQVWDKANAEGKPEKYAVKRNELELKAAAKRKALEMKMLEQTAKQEGEAKAKGEKKAEGERKSKPKGEHKEKQQ